ncbi:heptaprenyl diphosphate synthase/octaprenyl-diphosphate synthase [Abditibacterium utsteinense]|uniref:Heptaprenyl diphosphate synthase/octaprenyl-diphosphate synthase n=1 Tax=Abditibacterium utsteinense TaxID=1960156 RepID=A0A2S8SXM6_9BACT|nr:polyprenyl synthetase family protein [Abditibacterium utsteinense]PQV65509.1 heptaprenyl diphosphate synthase/octaprenyl-diphosphate synthase [Abditibacterium utsteinense]
MSQNFNGNGAPNGAPNGAGATLPLLDRQPDLHGALEEAVQVSSQRGTPLTSLVTQAMRGAADAAAAGAIARENPEAVLPAAKAGSFKSAPVPAWNAMPPQILEGIRHVDIMQSLAPLAPRMKSVEREIEKLITTPVKLVADIAGHVLGAGGKRLRPALTLLSAEVCGDESENPSPRAVTCAALVELTHTTTLLHDDVVDSATMRRGRPAANLIWGNETSVLVGDYLFAQVFVTASRRGIAELMHPLAHATAQMCAGELLETQMRGFWEMTEKQYLEIVALKTGSLTECACRMGALAIDASEENVEALGTYGRSIGVAFQIVDDVFDVISTSEELGKPVGNDLREGAITLPMLRALKNSPDRNELQEILVREEKSDADVLRALEIMRGGDAVAYAMQLAKNYAEAAKNELKRFPEVAACDMLCDIADYVLSREK